MAKINKGTAKETRKTTPSAWLRTLTAEGRKRRLVQQRKAMKKSSR